MTARSVTRRRRWCGPSGVEPEMHDSASVGSRIAADLEWVSTGVRSPILTRRDADLRPEDFEADAFRLVKLGESRRVSNVVEIAILQGVPKQLAFRLAAQDLSQPSQCLGTECRAVLLAILRE